MLPFDHGWYPQPNIYAGKHANCVWGNIPYNSGDFQIDKFFQLVYPGYKLANQCATRDERGMVTNTPLGDSFDVILSNAGQDCLRKYQVVILLGSWQAEMFEEARPRLDAFARAGGMVLANLRESGNLETLKPILQKHNLIEIDGRPIYYLVNVTDQPDELLVTLSNNSAGMPWEGRVRVKGQEIVEVEEWLAHGEADIQQGALRCGVPANDVRVFKVKTREAFLPLRFRDVPWKKLGFGVPE
jgi:hypothetical protein